MNNELLQKIQEKLGWVIDLINLDNTEKVYNYVLNYVKTQAIVEWCIMLIILLIIVGFTIFAFKKSDNLTDDFWNLMSALSCACLIIILVFFICSTYNMIMTTQFPAIKVIEWLK